MPIHKIYTHPNSGGEIHQSGALQIPGMKYTYNTKGFVHTPYIAKALKEHDISMVALTAADFQVPLHRDQPEGFEFDVLHIPFDDSQTLLDDELETIKAMVIPAAKKMAAAVKEGRKVLSTCWAGINRSSLLTAHTMKLLDLDLTPLDIVRQIRDSRYRECLNNIVFQDIVFRGAWFDDLLK